MGASILAASGLEELICPDLATYQAKAIALAQYPTRLAELKQYLLDHLHELPLFDNQQFARNLEAAYWQMWETALEEAGK
jgi:predicted O-linked N-acetylglucosamine transferase (SPINDLY family)